MTLPETRVLHFTTRMVVAFKTKEGIPPKPNYTPLPRPILKSQSKDIFNSNLDEWRKVVEKLQYDKYYNAAVAEAEGMGTDAFLENFDMYNIYTEQINKKDTQKQIQEKLRKYNEQRQKQKEKDERKIKLDKQKRKTQLEKLQKKAEQRPIPEPVIVPVTIDEQPTTLTFKKELSTMDIVQISKLHKSIAKLEKIKAERQSFIDMYNERIKSERIDLLLSSTRQRDEWQDIIDITNRKIEKQKEAIEKIQLGG